jgi:hypothetical protein
MEPTYVFEEGQVYTLSNGKVIAAVPEGEFDAQGQGPVEMPPPPPDIQDDLAGGGVDSCPSCGAPNQPGDHFCAQCGQPVDQGQGQDPSTGQGMENPYPHNEPSPGVELGGEAGPYMASGANQYDAGVHITTPNGLTGKVLGKTAGLWGEEVAVRLENGNIAHLQVNKDFKFASEAPEVSEEPIKALNARLAASVDPDKDSLRTRAQELLKIKVEAQNLIEGATNDELIVLDEIISSAIYEGKEVDEALQHFAELEGQAYEPPAPFRINVVEQEAVNGADGSWLSSTLDEMIAEAEGVDYEKLMDEGPEAFVASLDDPAVADAGVVRGLAQNFIAAKTAAADPKIRERYEKTWLARVEERRRTELASRKEATQEKQAAVEEEDHSDLPDEFGFGT